MFENKEKEKTGLADEVTQLLQNDGTTIVRRVST
jgi:hypothetical protein